MTTATTPAKRRARSVVKTPTYETTPAGGLILSLSSIADDFPPWGQDPLGLDLKLRSFWPTESYMGSAIYAIATRNSAFSWTLQGPDRTVDICREMLVENWVEMVYQWNIDYLTQNNGAFMEIIRETDSLDSPCIGIRHLDSARCRRTGIPEYPVVYTDIVGLQHKLKPHQIWAMADMPSPIETMNGIGMCAVYRVLREVERMRDISVHDREKLSGAMPKGLFIIGNVGQKQLQDVLQQHRTIQLEKGYVRYIKPAIMGVLDPAKPATVEQVEFSQLPDGFDKDKELNWYITVLALALGCDYQDLAPLSTGNLGTSTQSQTLHLKSKGKGPAMYMKRFAHMMNFSGILPRNVEFEFDEKDVEDDIQQAELSQRLANERQVYITTGVKSALAVRTEMLENGEITQEIFDLMVKEDAERKQREQERLRLSLNQWAQPKPTDARDEDEDAPSGDIRGEALPDAGGKARRDYAEALRDKLEGALASDMRVALKKALALLTERIKREAGAKAVSDIPDDPELWEDIRIEVRAALQPHIRKIGQAAATYKFDLGLAVDMDTVDQRLLEFTRSYTNDWWAQLEPVTREGLRDALATWQESGLGKRGLPDLISTLEDTLFSPERAKRIAVTEVTRIFDEGNRVAERTAGIQNQVWLTARDDVVCEICLPLDGEIFPIDQPPFPVTDTHINCRCVRTGITMTGEVLRD